MCAFQSLTHNCGITDAFKAVVCTTVSQLYHSIHHVFHLAWIDEMRHTKLAAQCFPFRIEINTDDFVSTRHACTLNDVQADSSQSEYSDICSDFHFGSKQYRTNASSHTTADVTGFIKRGIFTNLCQSNFRNDNIVGKSRSTHIVHNGLAIE